MILKEVRATYYELTGKVSDIVRQLGFVGLGIIWIFKYGEAGNARVPSELIPAAIIMILALSFDLLQYVVGSLVWGIFARRNENAGKTDEDVVAAKAWFNRPALFFFWCKTTAIIVAYTLLLSYLTRVVL